MTSTPPLQASLSSPSLPVSLSSLSAQDFFGGVLGEDPFPPIPDLADQSSATTATTTTRTATTATGLQGLQLPLVLDSMPQSRIHTCKECGKGFKQASDLRKHTRVHTGEEPYMCPWPGCGKRFSVNSNMHAHHRLHQQPRPPKEVFTCGFEGCGRVLQSAARLRNHERRHGVETTKRSCPSSSDASSDHGGRGGGTTSDSDTHSLTRSDSFSSFTTDEGQGPLSPRLQHQQQAASSQHPSQHHPHHPHHPQAASQHVSCAHLPGHHHAVHPCPHEGCPRTFMYLAHLRSHVASHAKEGIPCTRAWCNVLSPTEVEAIAHALSHHGELGGWSPHLPTRPAHEASADDAPPCVLGEFDPGAATGFQSFDVPQWEDTPEPGTYVPPEEGGIGEMGFDPPSEWPE
jgi:hypothetical protein